MEDLVIGNIEFIRGRIATNEDVDAGRAAFCAPGMRSEPIGEIAIPQYARTSDFEHCIVIQAERIFDNDGVPVDFVGLFNVRRECLCVVDRSEVELLGPRMS